MYVKKSWRWIGNLAFTVNLCCVHPQLVGVDVMAALDMYAEQEQWEKCLEVAAKQVSTYVRREPGVLGSLKQGQQE